MHSVIDRQTDGQHDAANTGSAGLLSLSCARLAAGRVTSLWVKRPLSVSQQGRLSLPSLRGRLTVRLCISKTLNNDAWGKKVPPRSLANSVRLR